MKLANLNEWLTLAANVGVLAGIVFLAVEVSQNTHMMRSQTRDSVTDKQLDLLLQFGSDEFTANVVRRAFNGELDFENDYTTELTAWSFLAQGSFRMWENEWYQFQQGLFDEPEYTARKNSWQNLVRTSPGHQWLWKRDREGYAPSFREQVDLVIGN